MTMRNLLLASTVLGAACAGLAVPAAAQNQVLSKNKPYAYFKAVPGQPPNHYQDDGPTHGPHKVHTVGLGTYGLGNLTDGVNSTAATGGPGTPHLAMWGACTCTPNTTCCGTAPAADIVIDLGTVQVVTGVVIGTVVAAGSNNNPPDDVTISYSLNGTSYLGAQKYDLETLFGPLADGHHDMPLKTGAPMPARYVKFSFDGGSMKEPNNSDPDEKYMLDELTVVGLGSSCTAAWSNYGTGLAGQQGVPTLTVSAPPKFQTRINVLGANSSGTATAGLVLAGIRELTLPFLGGILLVDPLVQVGAAVPAGGLVLPVTVPGPPCGVPICVQLLQLDQAATGGVSMTRGLRLDLGT